MKNSKYGKSEKTNKQTIKNTKHLTATQLFILDQDSPIVVKHAQQHLNQMLQQKNKHPEKQSITQNKSILYCSDRIFKSKQAEYIQQ